MSAGIALAALAFAVRWLRLRDVSLTECQIQVGGDLIWFLRTSLNLMMRVAAVALAELVVVAVLFFTVATFIELCIGAGQRSAPWTRGQREDVVPLTPFEVVCAAKSFEAYDNPAERSGARPCRHAREGARPSRPAMRYAERFWLAGGVFGFVDTSHTDNVYVVFRGTSEFGNWFLTNAQAHMVEGADVFGDRRVKGGVHHGFVKAFRDLWIDKREEEAGGRPASTGYRSSAGYTGTKFFWAPIVAAMWGWPVLGGLFRPPDLAHWYAFDVFAWLTGLLFVVQGVIAWGYFERRFHRSAALTVGPSLSSALTDVGNRHVVFTGHSLGGALAALAFVAYRRRADARPASLVTFGAPRPGNDAFLAWLGADVTRDGDAYMSLVADRSDPVPTLAPSKGFVREVGRRATWLSAVLAAIYIVGWWPYAVAYRARFGGKWRSMLNWRGADGLTIGGHFSYSEAAQRQMAAAVLQPTRRRRWPRRASRRRHRRAPWWW